MNTVLGSWRIAVAAKRLPPNDGEQNFAFLSSDDHAELTDARFDEPRAETAETFMFPVATPDSDVEQLAVNSPPQVAIDVPVVSAARDTPLPTPTLFVPDIAALPAPSTGYVSGKLFVGVVGYALALTLLLLGMLMTGRMSLFGNHPLESLPDLRPLDPQEFRKVPDGAKLPDGHVLRLGESRRFGDVVVTPVRLTKEPLQFQGFLSGAIEEKLTTVPVMKLWLNFKNVAVNYAFSPCDAGLMSNRSPADSKDAATFANTFLTIGIPSGDFATTRRLNFLHTMDSNFVIVGQESGKILLPGESLTTFVAESDADDDVHPDDKTTFVWRVQFRKGVNLSSGSGVTTLIDIKFSGADVATSG